MRRTYLTYTVGALALMIADQALAQGSSPPPAETTGVADIIVTAQRRSESVQKASVPIDVVSGDALAAAGATQVRDLAAMVPGVQIGQGGSATQIYIRGVGDFGTTPISNAAVAFNVDGVYVARSQAVEGNFYDIERVEVLKGPQGTLYGRNASGGAINVITAKPNPSGGVNGFVSVDVGNFDRMSASGAINLPLSSTLAARAAFQIIHRSGYLSDGWDDQKQQSARLQLLWKPDDRMSLLLGGDYSHVGGVGSGWVSLPGVPGQSPWLSSTDPRAVAYFNQLSVASGLCVPNVALPPLAFNNPGACPQTPLASTQLTRFGGDGRRSSNNEYWSVRAEFNYDFDFATLTVLPAYRSASISDTTYPSFMYTKLTPETAKQTSVEVRLGNESEGLKWVLGAFYFNEDQSANFLVDAGPIQYAGATADIGTRSYAAFGQATYSLTNALRVIGGVRYTSDQRTLSGYTVAYNPGLGYAGLAFAGQCGLPPSPTVCRQSTFAGDRTFEQVNWRAGAEYDVGPSNMLYLTAATGFKAGGFSANLAPGVVVSGPSAVGLADSYRPESLTAYEFGSRNRFFNNRLQLNFEAFLWKYKDHQESRLSIDALGNVIQTYVNAGSATMYGFDIDAVAKITRNDTLMFGVEYLHSEYDEFTFQQPTLNPGNGQPLAIPGLTTTCTATPVVGAVNTSTIDCSGKSLNRAPRWSGNAAYLHRFELGGGAELEFKGDMNFVSSHWLSIDFLPTLRSSAYALFNASLTYSDEKSGLEVSAFIRNIGDEAVFTSAVRSPFVPGLGVSSIGAPRTFGASAKLKF